MKLTGKHRRYLRSLGHRLQPVVVVGKAGLTGGVLLQLDKALEDHELIKIRFGRSFEGDREQALAAMVDETAAVEVGGAGHTVLLYRPRAEEPSIRLPPSETPG